MRKLLVGLIIVWIFGLTLPLEAAPGDRERYERLSRTARADRSHQERIHEILAILSSDGDPLTRVSHRFPQQITRKAAVATSPLLVSMAPSIEQPSPSMVSAPQTPAFTEPSAPPVPAPELQSPEPTEERFVTPVFERISKRLASRREERYREAARLGIILPSQFQTEPSLHSPSAPTEVVHISPDYTPPAAPKSGQIKTELNTALTLYDEKPSAPAKASGPKSDNKKRFSFSVEAFQTGVSGKLTSKGMALDLKSGANLDKPTAFRGQLSFALSNRSHLRFGYTPLTHSGSLQQSVTFDSNTYLSGSSVNLDTQIFDTGVYYEMARAHRNSWGFLGGAQFLHQDFEMAQPVAGGKRIGRLDQDFGFPYIGITGKTQLSEAVGIEGNIKGFSIARGGDSMVFHDAQAKLLFGKNYEKHPSPTEWQGFIGYRHYAMNGNADNETGKIGYAGPIIGIIGTF